jgi:NAD(P)H-dependent flavin oxidoreductase YrpB (nitropropane dioxygenase family)
LSNFIFMLTYNDVTVPNAIEVFEEVKDTGIKYVGFKDIGLPVGKLKSLVNILRKEKRTIFLEVVSETEEANIRSAKRAIELGVDYLIGGTYVKPTLNLLKGTGIKYCPYIGKVVGHPCLLRGTISEISEDAKKMEALGVAGINLLAYRYDGDVDRLITSVLQAVNIPVIIAGSINSFERVRRVVELGAWGFTIGGAIFDKKFVPSGNLRDQIIAVMKEVEKSKFSVHTPHV